MTTFVYTSVRVDKPSDPYTRRLVRVWRMAKGGPVLVGYWVTNSLDSFQMAMQVLVSNNHVPRRLINHATGLPRRADLSENGIHVHCLSDDTMQTLKQDAKG